MRRIKIEVVIEVDFEPNATDIMRLRDVARDATLAIGTRVRPSGEHREPSWPKSSVPTGNTTLISAEVILLGEA